MNLELLTELQNLPQVKEELEHYFVDGMYCRVMSLPKGVFVVGHKHKKHAINILAKGILRLPDGSLIKAPYVFITEPNTQKAAITIEDVVFINIFSVDATTVEEVEEEIAEPINNNLPYKRRKELKCQ